MLKYNLLFVFLLTLLSTQAFSQGVAINDDNTTANSSAMLDVKSTNKGMLVPRMTTTQRNAIASPVKGLLVFDNTTSSFWFYSGTAWTELGGGGAADADFFVQGSSNTPTSITDNIYTRGNLGVGQSLNDASNLVVSGTATTLKIGTTSYNNVQSGRLVFEENLPDYTTTPATYCGFAFEHDGANNNLKLNTGCVNQINIITFERDGNVGIGTENPTAKLSVNGTADKTGGGAWAAFSDRRVKKDIIPYTDGLSKILAINPVKFKYIKEFAIKDNPEKEFVGVIAQEVQEIAPYMVEEITYQSDNRNPNDADYEEGVTTESKSSLAGENILSYDASALNYMLINAVQEQQAIIEEQATKIKALETEVEAIKTLQEEIKQIKEQLAQKEK